LKSQTGYKFISSLKACSALVSTVINVLTRGSFSLLAYVDRARAVENIAKSYLRISKKTSKYDSEDTSLITAVMKSKSNAPIYANPFTGPLCYSTCMATCVSNSGSSRFKSGIVHDTEMAGFNLMAFQLIPLLCSTLSGSNPPLDPDQFSRLPLPKKMHFVSHASLISFHMKRDEVSKVTSFGCCRQVPSKREE